MFLSVIKVKSPFAVWTFTSPKLLDHYLLKRNFSLWTQDKRTCYFDQNEDTTIHISFPFQEKIAFTIIFTFLPSTPT